MKARDVTRSPFAGSAPRPPPGWRHRVAAVAAAALIGLCVVVGVHNVGPRLAIWRGNLGQDLLGLPPGVVSVYLVAMEASVALGFLVVGSLIAWRHWRDRGALFVSVMLATFGLTASQLRDADRAQPWLALGDGVQAIGTWSLLALYFLFPDGRFTPRWTRPVAAAWTVLIVVWLLYPEAPLNILHAETFNRTLWASTVFGASWGIVGLAAQWARYRSLDDRLQRQQIKWVLFGFVVAWCSQTLFYLGLGVIKTLDLPLHSRHAFRAVSYPLVALGLLALPASIGLAVERLRLFDVDRLLQRTLAYFAVTGVLGGAYLLLVLWAQTLLQQIGGESATSISVAASTLVVALLFLPLHRRIQRIVDLKLRWKSGPEAVLDGAPPLSSSLGPYRLLERVGSGATATVFRARHSKTGDQVAVKVLLERYQRAESAAARFRREAEVVSRLEHASVVRLIGHGETADLLYLVMEYIEGPDLEEVLAKSGACPLHEVRRWISDVASALDYAHGLGVVHRDLKPSNVMLRGGGRDQRPTAVLTDFGLARMLDAETELTAAQAIGTAYYMSPEQIRFPAEVGPASDIYGLGAMTHHLLAGAPPFVGPNAGSVLMAHLRSRPPSLSLAAPDLPAGVAAAVRRALEKQPAKRFATATAFADALWDGAEPGSRAASGPS
ncbi:MAG TPA: serine/threonine-protein kinase [Thermoanaerobaculia bacterium]|nr:serine/threonine-protein kinase [Thermoanaerobaculia bacterium]